MNTNTWKIERQQRQIIITYTAQASTQDHGLRSWIAQLPFAALCPEHGSVEANARLIAKAPEMLEILIMALPYVECAESDPGYKAGAVAKVTRQIRALLAEIDGKDGTE